MIDRLECEFCEALLLGDRAYKGGDIVGPRGPERRMQGMWMTDAG